MFIYIVNVGKSVFFLQFRAHIHLLVVVTIRDVSLTLETRRLNGTYDVS